MKEVEDTIEKIIRWKKGYVHRSLRLGGPTKFGITMAMLAAYRRTKVTVADINDLGVREAKMVYLEKYYFMPRFDRLPPVFRRMMVDSALRVGTKEAVRELQRLLNKAGQGPLSEDGVLGSKTLSAVRNGC